MLIQLVFQEFLMKTVELKKRFVDFCLTETDLEILATGEENQTVNFKEAAFCRENHINQCFPLQ